jgi:hypothetical protein
MVIANPLPPNCTHLALSLTLGRRHRPTLSLAQAGAAALVWCRAGGPACQGEFAYVCIRQNSYVRPVPMQPMEIKLAATIYFSRLPID